MIRFIPGVGLAWPFWDSWSVCLDRKLQAGLNGMQRSERRLLLLQRRPKKETNYTLIFWLFISFGLFVWLFWFVIKFYPLIYDFVLMLYKSKRYDEQQLFNLDSTSDLADVTMLLHCTVKKIFYYLKLLSHFRI